MIWKAISLWQPWASLWLSPRKIHETRHWQTPHRGWLLVHAAKHRSAVVSAPLREILERQFGARWEIELPRGAIIGRVELLDCIATDSFPISHCTTPDYFCGDFSNGRYGWKRGAFEVFADPIPYRGQQSMFDVHGEMDGRGFKLLPKPPAPQGTLAFTEAHT